MSIDVNIEKCELNERQKCSICPWDSDISGSRLQTGEEAYFGTCPECGAEALWETRA